MDLYPAIDVRGGNVVRLHKGNFNEETIYDQDPVVVAKQFAADGAKWIHVVDLDAAKTGQAINRGLIKAIAESSGVQVQTGGGIRSSQDAADLLENGVERVVLGTAAIENPQLVQLLADRYPGRIAVGLDARNGMVAGRGWIAGSQLTVNELVEKFVRAGVAAFIVTDIERDGTLEGPDVAGLQQLSNQTSVDVIASGGVGSLFDLQTLQKTSVAGVIVGKALYENRFTLKEALAVCS